MTGGDAGRCLSGHHLCPPKGLALAAGADLLVALPFPDHGSTFFLSNMTKFFGGGSFRCWSSLGLAIIMFTWWRGTQHGEAAHHSDDRAGRFRQIQGHQLDLCGAGR